MKYITPAQDKLKAEIRNKMEQLQNFKTSGFASTENINQLEESTKLLEKKKTKLKMSASSNKITKLSEAPF